MAAGYRDAKEPDIDPGWDKAIQVIKDWIESLPFPAIANDWQREEITCVAMNDHYVENQNCPREFLMNKNNRVLDPTHLTSLPGVVRVGIRAALAYGYPFDTNFETVMSASPTEKFIKRVSIRTVLVGGLRFVVGWQHHLGKDLRYGSRCAEWWLLADAKLKEKAAAANMEVFWIAEKESRRWAADLTGTFQQTDILCRKENLDEVLIKAVNKHDFAILLCDPFLPECPVIALNEAAQKLTGWGPVGNEVTRADAKLMAGADALHRGAQYLTYGRYSPGEEEERIAVRTACANGRPTAASFRPMYSLPGECSMWLQGVSLAQGVNKGPLSGGGNVWYLVGLLSSEPKERWAEAAPTSASMAAVKVSFQEILDTAETALPCQTVPCVEMEAPTAGHPYGGDIRLVKETLWHMSAAPEPESS
ncbi:unnamed protein product [Effrenium voratum]|nr:unnamed protein product [Effrenium voratum]